MSRRSSLSRIALRTKTRRMRRRTRALDGLGILRIELLEGDETHAVARIGLE